MVQPRLSGVQPQDTQEQLENVVAIALYGGDHHIGCEVCLPEIRKTIIKACFLHSVSTNALPRAAQFSRHNERPCHRFKPCCVRVPISGEQDLLGSDDALACVVDQLHQLGLVLWDALEEIMHETTTQRTPPEYGRDRQASRRVGLDSEIYKAKNLACAHVALTGYHIGRGCGKPELSQLSIILHIAKGLKCAANVRGTGQRGKHL